MAEILKITTPLTNKNQVPPTKQSTDPSVPFNLQEISKVVKPNQQGEILKQNNGMIQKEDSSAILTSLLKDPSATVNFLKNIYVLQEIIKLLPVNNATVTHEIEQMFNSLLVSPDDIAAEMMRQEHASTSFRGELFNFLRSVLAGNPPREVRAAVANLLKSINNMEGQHDVLDAVSNSLQFLSDGLSPSKSIAQRLQQLSDQFRFSDAADNFSFLKTETMAILKEVEGSILFSPKMEKVIAITLYNLSRFNDNPDFFSEAVTALLRLLDGQDQRRRFVSLVRGFESGIRDNSGKEGSKIMDVLTKLIGMQADDADLSTTNAEKLEKIITSLLSSPCNFTPLLHFVIPVELLDIKSFAEIWINPNGEEDDREGREANGGDTIHMLIVFDVEGIGQFEAEIYAAGKTVDLSLFCPPAYKEMIAGLTNRFERCIASNGSFRPGKIRVDKLERPRSLMEVFKSLPYKRAGVDVKV